jgi:hypothetical protein
MTKRKKLSPPSKKARAKSAPRKQASKKAETKVKAKKIALPSKAAPAKPSAEECLAYAKNQVAYYIKRHASSLPREQRQEIIQNCFVRVLDAYVRIDASRGWKSFIQNHARGSVLDYLAAGEGFEEAILMTANGGDEGGSGNTGRPDRLRFRISTEMKPGVEGSALGRGGGAADDSIDALLGKLGIFADGEEVVFNPNWPLLSRMAAIDRDIHLLAKILMGCTQAELAESFGVSRERLSQRIRLLFEKLDSPQFYNNKWVKQTIYAFGIWELYGMNAEDQGLAWNIQPVNLFEINSVTQMKVDLRLAML